MLLPLTFNVAKMLDRLLTNQYKPAGKSVSKLHLWRLTAVKHSTRQGTQQRTPGKENVC